MFRKLCEEGNWGETETASTLSWGRNCIRHKRLYTNTETADP